MTDDEFDEFAATTHAALGRSGTSKARSNMRTASGD